MSFTIEEDLWFGGQSEELARQNAAESLAALSARVHGVRPFPIAAQRLVDRVVDDGDHLAAQRDDVFARDDPVGVLRFPRAAEDQPGGAAVVDAELALQAVGGLLLAGELEHERVHPQFNALHVLGPHALLAQLHAGVDARVDDDAAGEGLVGVEGDLEALAELVGGLVPGALGRQHLRIAARRLERTRAGGEAVARQQRRQQPGARRAAGVEGLGHGAELLAQPEWL